MTQSNDMPKEIYVFPDPKSIGDRGFTLTEPEKTCEGLNYTKYIRADLTPPQSPNRAVLDVLRSILSALPSRRDWLDPVLEEQAYDAIAAANQADEPIDLDSLKKDTSNTQELLAKCEDFTVGYNTGWNACIEHLKRQKGR